MSSHRRKYRSAGLFKGYSKKTPDILLCSAFFIAAVILRFVFFVQLKNTPFFENLFSDSLLYSTIAKQIVTGTLPEQAYFMSPLYPYILAIFDMLGMDHVVWMRVTQIFISSFGAVLLFFLGRDLFNRKVGIIAAVLAVFNPLWMYYDSALLIESSFAFIILLYVFVMLKAEKNDSVFLLVISGLLFGICVVYRANIMLFFFVWFGYVFFRKKQAHSFRSALIHGIATLMVILPFTIHNYQAERIFIPITSSAGYNLYVGNNASAQGFYTMPEAVDLYADPNGKSFAERASGQVMNSKEVSSFWMAKSMEWIRNYPADFLLLLGRKCVLFFSPKETDQMGLSFSFVAAEFGTLLNFPLPGFAAVFPFAVLGLIIAVRKKSSSRFPLMFLLVFFLSTILFFVNGRLRFPVTPLLILYAGAGIAWLWEMMKTNAWRGNFRILGLWVLFVTPLYALQPDIREAFDQEFNKLGQIAFDRGSYMEAEGFYRKSFNAKRNVEALSNLGNACAAQKKFHEAERYYSQAMIMNPNYALAYFNYGNLAMERGQPNDAYIHWKKASELQPFMAPAIRNIGILFMQTGRNAEALSAFQRYLELEKKPANRVSIERDVATLKELLRKTD